jgi:hypothetical protein
MPIPLTNNAPTLLVRRDAFERAGLSRASIDQALTLTDEEFRVERDLVAIGPIYADDGLTALVRAFEDSGLVYYDDFFELSGNWPDWLSVLTTSRQ